jgi:hypothetical protein
MGYDANDASKCFLLCNVKVCMSCEYLQYLVLGQFLQNRCSMWLLISILMAVRSSQTFTEMLEKAWLMCLLACEIFPGIC